ncbi:MAG: protein-arginine deiminase domain-containing protein, partial [Kiritimatiellaeota bacterium]|nr:protein-arginine deiminase domain-containing protein [Kiritimatiellota bacterium]
MHKRHHSPPAKLTHLSANISLCGDGGAPLTVGSQTPKGGVVHVTGNTPSTAPRAALAVFEWTENGKTEAQTNAFTVMSSPILGDLDLDGYSIGTEDILGSLFPGPGGWFMPAEPGALRLAHLPPCTYLPGDTVLTLESGQGAVRLWEGWSNSLLLLPGQSVTNYADYQVRVEAVSNGTARLTRTFTGTGAATNLTCSGTLTITASGGNLLADTDRNAILNDLDRPGKDKWSITRGALIPPCRPLGLGASLYVTNAAPLSVSTDGLQPGMTAWLSPADITQTNRLAVFDAGCSPLGWGGDGRIPIPPGVATNLHVLSNTPRKCAPGGAGPDAFDLRLTVADAGGAPVLTDTVRLKVAPLILPPECSPATAVYSTHAIPAVAGLTQANAGLNASRWTQDMVKLAKVQCAGGPWANVALGLDYDASSQLTTFLSSLQMMRAGWTFSEQECGNGGNMMATPPLPDAPYGKIMLGTAHNESKAYWEAQGIQPVIDIPNNWLLVGHVDELFMWITTNRVLCASPWAALEALHGEIAWGGGTNTVWCGWDAAGKNNTFANVAVEGNKMTRLLAPMGDS